jgi:hypothetical protein
MDYSEWLKILTGKGPSGLLGPDQLEEHPELKVLVGLAQDPRAHPEGDVWTHTYMVVDNAAKTKKRVPSEWRTPYLFAALLHDSGKAAMPEEERDAHFTGHSNYSIEPAADFLLKIGAPEDVIRNTLNLVRWHHAPFDLKEDDLEQWKVIRGQVPLKVLAWFSRCDSFAGARHGETAVQAVHAASERTLRAEKVLAAEPKVVSITTKLEDVPEVPPAGLVATESLALALTGMVTEQLVTKVLDEVFRNGMHMAQREDSADRAKIAESVLRDRIRELTGKVKGHVAEAESLIGADEFHRRMLASIDDIKTGLKHLNEKIPG